MKVILDASCAMEIIFNRGGGGKLKQRIAESDESLAPDLLFPEVVNGVWKAHHFGGVSLAICDEALAVLNDLTDTLVPAKDLYHEAFVLSREYQRPAYDMFYLALAKREDAILLTLDSKLKKEAKREGIRTA